MTERTCFLIQVTEMTHFFKQMIKRDHILIQRTHFLRRGLEKGHRHHIGRNEKTSRSQSPSRKYSGSLPRKYSRSKSPKHRSGSQHSPAQWKMKSPQPHSRSRSPKCSTKSTSTGRKKNSYSPRHRDRSRSPKSPSRSEAYHHYKRPSNSTPNEKTILSSHQNKRSEYTPTSEENKVKETSDDVSTQGATGALASKAVRDLLRQGLGPRTKQYSDLTDEMVLVSCFEAVFFMKKCYKYQLVIA